jgi:hypothetical protein
VGLVMVECAKPNEYNVWLMFKAPTTFFTIVLHNGGTDCDEP